jgi:hypothetical protein
MRFGGMINNIIEGALALKSAINFSTLTKESRRITFYSESASYYPHIELLLKTVLEQTNISVCLLSSSRNDTGLAVIHPRLNSFFIGSGFVRNYIFENIDTQLLILTMPDLNNFQVKRSRFNVHYVYTQHSLVSSHMIYRYRAFDHYDTILCAGPHHIAEIEATERRYNLRKKNLVKFGYPRLDRLINYGEQKIKKSVVIDNYKKELLILIAPSWGPEGIIESGLCFKLIKKLLELGHKVIIRPHPQTIKFNNEKIIEIRNTFSLDDRVILELDVEGYGSFLSSDIMISDWSGVAMEYALGFKKPVIFCSVPKKINNPKYLEIDLVPLEVSIRNEIGTIWDTKSPIEKAIIECKNKSDQSKFESLTKKYVYNLKKSDEAFINLLQSLKLI